MRFKFWWTKWNVVNLVGLRNSLALCNLLHWLRLIKWLWIQSIYGPRLLVDICYCDPLRRRFGFTNLSKPILTLASTRVAAAEPPGNLFLSFRSSIQLVRGEFVLIRCWSLFLVFYRFSFVLTSSITSGWCSPSSVAYYFFFFFSTMFLIILSLLLNYFISSLLSSYISWFSLSDY